MAWVIRNFKATDKVVLQGGNMAASDWILQLLLGGILGIVGQGIRVVAGLKKVNDQAVRDQKAFGELFQLSTLLISLFIGFVAGALAMIAISDMNTATLPDKQTILTFIGAGYAGTDFIEGFIRKYLPEQAQPAPSSASGGSETPAVG